MDTALPPDARVASILVIIYSVICLASSALLSCVLWSNGERTTYLLLIAIASCGSTTASIVQQIYYACQWRTVVEVAWEQAKLSIDKPGIALGPLFTGFNLGLYLIQFCIYNIIAILVFCWSVALLKGVYNLQFKRLAGWEATISITSRVLAIVVPALLIGLSFLPSVQSSASATLAIGIVLIMASYGLGGVFVVAVLIRYIHSRHLFSSFLSSSRTHTTDTLSTTTHGTTSRPPKIRVDRILLIRFSIAFFILAAFEVTIACFESSRAQTSARLAVAEGPEYSARSAIASILLFLPAVTGSLLAFLLFGTTAHNVRKYMAVIKSIRFPRRRRASLTQTVNSPESWNRLDDGTPKPLYRCTIRSEANREDIELGDSGPFGKVRTSVVVHDDDRLPIQSNNDERPKDRNSWRHYRNADRYSRSY
ncbi:hypothetical protein LTR78_006124 [Recurvomyces mirabilis]|uniref:Uncharacterized protein n=1 Tax=Recurvomyces mirabilis TaxID=574656 RepID=A0AAE0WLH3_9PEZI|nr:hypothetical protein LTR78_006124 [Recurvomyces mirabilis]KAK5151967.1 hypothetical protein LTS14_008741 [Recurvomyces mirabilis]